MELNINTLFIAGLALFIGYNIFNYYRTPYDPYQIPTGALPVPMQVGKTRSIVSKTGDASMRTEYNRRRAIIGSNSGLLKKFGYKDSTNGSLETFFLSSIWPTGITKSSIFGSEIILDGGSAYNVPSLILDGNGGGAINPNNVFIDGGNAYTIY